MVTYDDAGGFDDQIPLPDAVLDHSPCLVWNKQHNVSSNAPTKCAHRSANFSSLGNRGVSAMMSPWVGKQVRNGNGHENENENKTTLCSV